MTGILPSLPTDAARCMSASNEAIATSVVERMGLTGRQREYGVNRLAYDTTLIEMELCGEIPASVHWTHEREGHRSGGLVWFDMRLAFEDFKKECQRFTFDDFYDHCPASL